MPGLDRAQILPEPELPEAAGLLAQGQRLARTVTVGPCPFLSTYGVRSESEYKRRRMAEGTIMLHAQFGYRSPAKSRRAYAEIYERLAAAGYRVDRYGICLDWSTGYPAAQRADMPRGTGLILEKPEDFVALTQSAPVAPHFGDFCIGTPAAVENTAAALAAGSTSIGNLGQYFTFRMPRWSDDVGMTAETVKALALCAAQPVEIMVHPRRHNQAWAQRPASTTRPGRLNRGPRGRVQSPAQRFVTLSRPGLERDPKGLDKSVPLPYHEDSQFL